MAADFVAVAAAGSLRSSVRADVVFAHEWTAEGVAVESRFTGAHLLHLAAAGCVLNDLFREAATLGLDLDGVRVSAGGGFDPQTWTSTGISYQVEIDSPADTADLARLVSLVDEVAEIPRALRAGTTVTRGIT
jgi:OsmC-like protein